MLMLQLFNLPVLDHAKAAKLVLQVATYSQYYFHYDPTAL